MDQGVAAAESKLQQGDPVAAALLLRDLLRQNPKDANARWLFANVSAELGDWPTAAKEYRRALECGIAPDSALGPLAVAMLQQDEFDELVSLGVPEQLSPATRSTLYALKSLAALQLGERRGALDYLDAARAHGGDHVYVALAEARLLRAEGNLAKASALLEEAVVEHPDSAWAWLRRGQLASARGDRELAYASYAAAAERGPWAPLWFFDHSISLIEQGRLDEAQPWVERILRLIPQSSPANYAAGRWLLASGRLEDAASSFELSLMAMPNHAESLYYLGQIQLKLGRQRLGEDNLRRVLALDPNAYAPRKLLADYALGAGRFEDAMIALTPPFAGGRGDADGLSVFAGALIGLGRPDDAIRVMRQAVEVDPESARQRERLALALIEAGEIAEAERELAVVQERDPELIDGDRQLVAYYLARGDAKAAFARAQSLRKRLPQRPDTLLLLALVELARGDVEQARRNLSKVPVATPARRDAVRALVHIARKAGAPDQAKALLEEQVADDPADIDSMIQRAELAAAEQAEADAEQWLRRAIATEPENLQPQLILARRLIVEGRPSDAIAVLREAVERTPDQPKLLLVYATALLANAEFEQARKTAERLRTLVTGSAGVEYLAARAALGLGNAAEAVPLLQSALTADPKLHLARRDLVRALLANGDSARAGKEARTLLRKFPEDPGVLWLAGQARAAQGDDEGARVLLARSYDAQPSRPVLLALARVEAQLGDLASAIERQRAWLAGQPEDTVVRLALANALSVVGQADAARSEWEAVLVQDPDNLLALNNLAWTLRQSDPERALPLVERAFALAPQSASIADTYAAVQAQLGELTLAERTLQRASEANPDNTGLVVHRAEVLAKAQRGDEAEALLADLLAKQEDFPERARAAALLAEIGAVEQQSD